MKYFLLPYGFRVVVLILTLAVFSLLGCSRTVISVDDMDKMIKHQVPLGSNKEQVKSFIDNLQVSSLRITRGAFDKVDKRKKPVGSWDPEKLDALWDRVEELISARIVDAQTAFMNRNDIFIQFAIDKDGKMIGYTVRMEGTE